ncbi:N-acetylmuramoyl-L-alanine amidase family protein [Oceanivirga miroungae]|uniref:N-acetylmuramoyl-L-alanine amidase n=1 Tax=Oceanivirga miroungae TaxID=1130046 RepID=A0A6I8M7C7_9FUSO|nr:N-acetylmuramoyl-L-alanine amidase [Oceanivirga miroungae]VWL85316.1 N-acetylmuramoyl-L-alanine amidase [Oceanivirga miroungae]
MIKTLKKFIILILLFTTYITFSNRLDSINYNDSEIVLTFSEKVPEYTESFDPNLPSISLSFKDTIKSRGIRQVIEINDNYLRDILSEYYDNETDVVIYLKENMIYTTYTVGRELKIRLREEAIERRKKYTIILDAGHGGQDSGAIGDAGYYEKTLALAVVLELYKNLKNDYKVILTRSDDTFIPLNKRAQIGNDNEADLFVSIHLNSGGKNKKAEGTEVFYYSKNPSSYARQIAKFENDFDKKGTAAIEASDFVISDVLYHLNQQQSAILASSVLENIVSTMKTHKRKSTGANFAVLRGSKSNAILIELGFITNHKDRVKFSSKSGQKRVAKAIADAIRKHY